MLWARGCKLACVNQAADAGALHDVHYVADVHRPGVREAWHVFALKRDRWSVTVAAGTVCDAWPQRWHSVYSPCTPRAAQTTQRACMLPIYASMSTHDAALV